MKKALLSSLLLFSLNYGAFAGEKVRLGIKVAPCISFATIKDKDSKDGFTFSSNGSAVRAILGPYADFYINDNVTFSTGLWYSPRTVMITGKYVAPITEVTTTASSQYNLQYLMVPLYFKYYTNEISSGMKIYFTLGGSADFKIAEKTIGDDNLRLRETATEEGKALFSFIDATLMIGTGVEFKLGDITTMYAGFSYNRGLLNIVNPLLSYKSGDETIKPYQYLNIKNNMVALDLGIRF